MEHADSVDAVGAAGPARGRRAVGAIAAVAGALLLLAALGDACIGGRLWLLPVAATLYGGLSALLWRGLPAALRADFGAANMVTLARGALICLVAAACLSPHWRVAHWHWIVVSALLALALDGVDGAVARASGRASAFGARFDMELDAFLILMLSAGAALQGKPGSWVLAIGAMRYLYAAAGRIWPWLTAPVPPNPWRRPICVVQIAALVWIVTPLAPPRLAALLAALALAALLFSFGADVWWLYRQRPRSGRTA
jgi:phosphatidylglycerophosphate synthase